jgi:hypothetical protein
MNHQSRLDSVLARYFGIQRGHELTDRHCRAAPASRDHPGAGRRGVDLHTAGALEWCKKLLQLALIASFHDQIHGVLALDHRFALNLQPELGNAWPAQVIEEHRAPSFLLRDRDALYGSVFSKRVAAMGVTEVVTAPSSPWQNPHVERVIGSIRRECLDHVVIFNERHLRRVLSSYVDYYQRTRTHLSLDKDCPDPRPIRRAGSEESWPSRRSAVCIIATNVSPPGSSRIPAHQWLRGGP